MQEKTPKTSPSALLRLSAISSGKIYQCGSYKNGHCKEKKNMKCDYCHSDIMKSKRPY